MKFAPAFFAALALAGCQSAMQAPEEAARATAQLQPTQGNKTIGEATFEDTGNGRVHVVVLVHGLKAGSAHPFHIRQAGDCSSGDARRAADLPALKADKRGAAKLDTTLSGMTVAPGSTSIVGRSLVVHADDGGRTPLACGVIHAS